eukprot:TRINITY_DN9551_c0_g1_i1.p1 TRINITY_DN9551_c0_g1~~TRINITY_DN9551_c0_g1_i1.p1  ORF type:complete len:703 (+),score=221.90 TRINITY_DN9551_c0_g1_i1:239-2347(+)
MAGVGDGSLMFSNILLGARGGMNPGQLKVHPDGFVWRKTGGGKTVEVPRGEISNVTWMRVPKGYQLAVRLKAGVKVKFNGFREQDVKDLTPFLKDNLSQAPKQKEFAVSGRNWGDAEIDGNMLSFNVGTKQAFEVAVADVAQMQLAGKNEVMLEMHVDDTTGANEKDSLMELSFFVPTTNSMYVGDDDISSAQVLKDKLMQRADVGPTSAESVVDFEGVHILTPRGRFKVELHISFLRLQGGNDFKIQYASVMRLFVLPKANQPHTFVVVVLDPPIRKGQTFYPHLVLQFPNDETKECSLNLTDDLFDGKYKDRLVRNYTGLSSDVFASILKGLSGSKVTRPGSFRSNSDGYAVRTSLKAEEGYLYPLEKSFFFLPKPPTLIAHDEIEHVEFERHGAGSSSAAGGVGSSYFDLVINLKSETQHQFRNIQRNEYHNLFNFFSAKRMKILNLGESKALADGTAGVRTSDFGADDDDEQPDPYLNIKTAWEGGPGGDDESDEEDEDFAAGEEEEDDSGEEEEGGSEGGDEDGDGGSADGQDSGGEKTPKAGKKEKEKKVKEDKKEKTPGVAKTPGAKRKKKDEEEEGDAGTGKKKQRKKKDPNAPKRSLSAFMLFSQVQREVVKRENPGIAFGEIGKVIGEKWKNLPAADKVPFEDQAKAAKVKYDQQVGDYKRSLAAGGAAGEAAAAPDGAGGGDEDDEDEQDE